MKDDATFRLFVENIGHTAVEEFVGNIGDVFYDPLTGDLRLSDGETAGGVSITSGSSIIEPPAPGEEIPPGDAGDIVAVPNADGQYFLYVYDGTDWQETHLTNAQVLTSDESPFTAAPGQLRQITLPDGSTLNNQQDINVYFATTVHQLKEDFETKIEEIDGRLDTNELDISVLKDTVVDLNEADGDLSDRLDVLETDPVTKEYVDDQDKLLSDRLDVLETDPVTKEYVDDQDNALSGRLDVLETDPTTKKYVDDELAKLEAAVDAASGGLIFIDDFSADNPLPDPSTLERGNFFICSSDTPYHDPRLTEIANEGDKAIVDDELGYVLINEVDADTLYLSKTGDDTTTGTITAAGLKSNSLNSVGATLDLGVSNSVSRISIDSSYTTLKGMVKVLDLRPLVGDNISINANLSFNPGLKIKGNGVDQLIIGQSDVSYMGGITSDKHIVTREYLESQAYELPVATVSTLGGIKIGAEFGLNNDDQLTLNPTTVATTSDLGFVKVGSNLDVTNNGTLSVKTDGGLDDRYVKKTGDTMTGTLTLTGDRAIDLNVDVTNGKIGNLKYNGNNRLGWGYSQVFVSGELVIQDPIGTAETGGIKMNNKRIYGLADPVNDQDAATKAYALAKTGDTMTGDLTVKADVYLDNAAEGDTWLEFKTSTAKIRQNGETKIDFKDNGEMWFEGTTRVSNTATDEYDVVNKYTLDRALQNSGSSLSPATSTQLGGVKIGSGVSVASDGKISVSTNYASSSHNHGTTYVKNSNSSDITISKSGGVYYITGG